MIIERHKRIALLFDDDFWGDTLAMFVKGVEY